MFDSDVCRLRKRKTKQNIIRTKPKSKPKLKPIPKLSMVCVKRVMQHSSLLQLITFTSSHIIKHGHSNQQSQHHNLNHHLSSFTAILITSVPIYFTSHTHFTTIISFPNICSKIKLILAYLVHFSIYYKLFYSSLLLKCRSCDGFLFGGGGAALSPL